MRFNEKNQVARPDVLTHEGGYAYRVTPEVDLVITLATFTGQRGFYSPPEEFLRRIDELLRLVDVRFAAAAALWVRHVHGNRTSAIWAAYKLARRLSGKPWARDFYRAIVRRPDDATELAALFLRGGGTLPAAVKKGLAAALRGFDVYQVSKYRGEGRAVKLVDVVRLTHPAPTDAIDALIQGEAVNRDTWEARLSAGADKRATWKELIGEGRLGYLALIRNARNIAQVADEELLGMAAAAITREEAIRGSLVWPHQIYAAYKAMVATHGKDHVLAQALERAIDMSVANVHRFDGRLCVLVDESGSMTWCARTRSVKPAELAMLCGAALAIRNEADMILFDTTARHYHYDDRSIARAAMAFRPQGGGTRLSAAFEAMTRPYDYVVVFTDMQFHDANFADALRGYRRRMGAAPMVVSFNLDSYGGAATGQAALQFGGFNPELIKIAEGLRGNALVEEVARIGTEYLGNE